MFAKSTIVALGFFGILAVAAPNNPPPVTVTVTATAAPPTQTVVSQCNTGTAQCCNTVGEASSSSIIGALGLLAGLLDGITGIVGLGCTPLSVIGIGSGVNCAQQPVCCTGNEFNGLINIGCSPISL